MTHRTNNSIARSLLGPTSLRSLACFAMLGLFSLSSLTTEGAEPAEQTLGSPCSNSPEHLVVSNQVAKPPAESPEWITDLSSTLARSLLEELGVAELTVNALEDRTTLVFRLEEYEISLRVYHQTKDLRIYAEFANPRELNRDLLEEANRWNREHRGAKCYLDTRHRWVLEADLVLTSGVSAETVSGFVTRFATTCVLFAEHFQVEQ